MICYLIMCHVPGLDNFLLKDLGKALALLYLAIGRLQGLKDKRRCCGCNILLAFRNGNATVTEGRSFARQETDHFPEISKKLKKRTWLWIFTGTANGPIHPQNQPRKRKKTDRRSGRRKIKKWWSWRLCSDTPIAPQNPAFLSIPRSRLARYDTSSTAFRLLIYGEKVGKKPFHGEEKGNF